jgi:hypothetical protein
MRGPLVERQAHLIEVVVFIVDAGHAWRSMDRAASASATADRSRVESIRSLLQAVPTWEILQPSRMHR